MNENNFIDLDEISASLSKLSSSLKYLESIDSGVKKLNNTCLELVGTLNELNEVNFNDFLSGGSSILGICASLLSMNETMGLASGTIKTMGSAFAATFASTLGPIGAVVGVMTLLVGAVAVFSDYESDATKETRLFNEAQEAKRNELIETSKAINESTASCISSAKSVEAQSLALKGFVDGLVSLTDENGYVKNFEQAQYYVDKINAAMPNTLKLTKDNKVEMIGVSGSLKENTDLIYKNIEQLERKAKVEAYYGGYVESLKNETKFRSELALAQNNYNSELEKQQGYQNSINELLAISRERTLTPSETEALTTYTQKLSESNETLDQYSLTLDKAKGAYEANAKGAELYQSAVGALDGSIEASAKLQLEEYTALDENGKLTWDSLAAASEDCKNRITTAQGEELETVKVTSGLLQEEMLKKAYEQGISYDEMVSKLKESGAIMNADEEAQLRKSYGLWQLNSKEIQLAQAVGLDALKLSKMTALSQMNENDKAKLSENVKLFAEKGDASGIELCNKLAASLEANNGEVNDETRAIMAQIEAQANNADPRTQIGVDAPSDKNMDDVNRKIDKATANRKTKVTVEAQTNSKTISIFGFKIPWFAEGGFPETGQLFVAREAGPELVGRINGKTAVANNDQIVSGISSGVFNAVRSAMAGNGGNGNMNIHATFVMDGDVVGKQVIKYHNGVVKRTGTTPLMI